MARFMVSMPDDMLEKLDRQARKESRARSELLREAVRRHLAAAAPSEAEERPELRKHGRQKAPWTKETLERHLLENGLSRRGCPGLDSLVGPVKGPADMKRVLRITKGLTGLSRQVIEEREDRL
jgi:predicted DNA-binding protein